MNAPSPSAPQSPDPDPAAGALVTGGMRIASLLVMLLAAVAAGLSIYLFSSGPSVAGCGQDAGCNEVLASRWSKWVNLPVSLAAAVFYGSIVVAAAVNLVPAFAMKKKVLTAVWAYLLAGGIVAVGAGVWFVGLQVFLLDRLCPFCIAVHTCGLLIAALVLGAGPWDVPAGDWEGETEDEWADHDDELVEVSTGLNFGRGRLALCVTASAVALVVLVAGQTLVEPVRYRPLEVSEVDPPTVEAAAAESRAVEVLDGKVRFDLADFICLGSADAEHVMVELFDYTCPQCRDQARQVQGMLNQLPPGKVAVALLPVPMNSICNPLIKVDHPKHKLACEYAKLSLAVQQVRPAAAVEFHEYLMDGSDPPSLEDARNFANRLVGSSELTKAILSGDIEPKLLPGQRIIAAVQMDALPVTVLDDAPYAGVITTNQLMDLVKSHFKLLVAGP